jgi:hypothetical protein
MIPVWLRRNTRELRACPPRPTEHRKQDSQKARTHTHQTHKKIIHTVPLHMLLPLHSLTAHKTHNSPVHSPGDIDSDSEVAHTAPVVESAHTELGVEMHIVHKM